jgi:hypothetical protein
MLKNKNNRAARRVGRITAGRKKKAQDERQPGQVSSGLRRRMGDALADLFNEFGPDIYSEAVLAMKDVILDKFRAGFEELDKSIREELGRRGSEESRQHIRNWSEEIVQDVTQNGLTEVANALEDFVATLTAEFQTPDEQEGEDLLEVEDEDVEPVDEVDEEEVEEVPEDGDEAAAPEVNLEELGLEAPKEEAAATFGPLGGRRRRPADRRLRFRRAERS